MIAASAKWIRRLVIGLVGFVVLVTGVAMLILPGPAFVVIPLGLAILSLEFAWARYLLRRLKERVSLAQDGEPQDPPRGSGAMQENGTRAGRPWSS